MGNDKIDILQGTLDMLILRILSHGRMHGWGIADRIQVQSAAVLSVGEGSLYPSLYRMQQKGWIKSDWALSENNRKAKYYQLTAAGKKQLREKEKSWQRLTGAVAAIMQNN